MDRDETLLEVARAIRPYLTTLVGPDAATYDQRIVELLTRKATGTSVDNEISDLLTVSATTQTWAAELIADPLHRPPEIQLSESAIQPLPGAGGPIAAQRFTCPQDGNFVWWQRSVGAPVPLCPDHQVPLVSG